MTQLYGTQIGSHLPCWKCGSSDAASIYQDAQDPDRYYGICYSNNCSQEFSKEEAEAYVEEAKGFLPSYSNGGNYLDEIPEYDDKKNPGTTRGIYDGTLRLYEVDYDNGMNFRLYAKRENGVEPVALKRRGKDKSFLWKKTYPEAPRDAGFFGQTVGFRPSKWVMITEGELDAMSAYQMLKKKMPVVSLKNGAKDVRLNEFQKEFLDKFEIIYLCFDADEQGTKAAKRFSQSFPPEKVRVVQLENGLKDANDYLGQSKVEEFNFAVSIAKSVVRQGLILGRDTLKYLQEDQEELLEYPYKGLNDMLYGMSNSGELITILSGSGLGKSTVIKAIGLHLFHTTPMRLGCLFMEENKRKTVKIFTGMEMRRNIVLPEVFQDTPMEDIEEGWEKVFDNDRWVLWDHWGSNETEAVLDTIRYMVSNFGAKVILLDHISIVLSGGMHGGDERKAIDQFMTGLRTLVNELEFICIAISHVTKGGDGTPHEEGGRVKLSHARGAGSIYQLSDTVLGLERNQQDENKALRTVTNVRVLKSRLSGETGPATRLAWDKNRGILRELTDDEYDCLQDITDPDEASIFLTGDF